MKKEREIMKGRKTQKREREEDEEREGERERKRKKDGEKERQRDREKKTRKFFLLPNVSGARLLAKDWSFCAPILSGFERKPFKLWGESIGQVS